MFCSTGKKIKIKIGNLRFCPNLEFSVHSLSFVSKSVISLHINLVLAYAVSRVGHRNKTGHPVDLNILPYVHEMAY